MLLIAADEAELATLDPVTDGVRIALLTDRIATRSASIDTLSSRNGELSGLITDHQTRVTELTTRNAELAALIAGHETRIAELTTRNTELTTLRDAHIARVAELTTRNAELAALNTAHETRITELTDRNFTLAEQRAQLEADLATAQAGCDTAQAEGLYYLHADHLGRPQFATDTSGSVVWDMGGEVTPFGDRVNLAGAFAQQLMFPGQYADLETGGDGDDVTLSHNWHRTYDPTLGRYLQSDPIGLAGGLNRYAYVGGNPMGYVDPMGLAGWLTIYSRDTTLGDFGHSFVSFKPDNGNSGDTLDSDCGCTSYGFYPTSDSQLKAKWPTIGELPGLQINEDKPSDLRYSSTSIYLSDAQEEAMYKAIDKWRNRQYSLAGSACGNFAMDIWNSAVDERLMPWWKSPVPTNIRDAIDRRNSK